MIKNRSLRIVVVTQSYHPRPGGVTEHVFHTVTALRRRGHDVTIITTRFDGHDRDEPGVVRLGRNVLMPVNGAWVNFTVGRRLFAELKQLLHALRPDIVHTHCPLAPTLPLMTLAAVPRGCRVVGTFHAAAERLFGYRIIGSLWGQLASRIDTRIAVSETARRLADLYFPGDYTVIPNGVDCERFSSHLPALEHLRDGRFNILFVGRMDKRKGLKYLFRAVAKLSENADRPLRLVVVGDDGPRRHLLPRLPPSVDLHFAGVVDKRTLPRYFATCDLFCSPAVERESFGIVLLEAMASGIPVVGTSIPGYLTILKDRWNARVIPPRSPEALSDAMRELMRDEHLRWELTRNAQAFSRRYHWERIVDELETIYAPAHSTVQNIGWSVSEGPMRAQKA